MATNGTTRCLLWSETRLKSHVAWGIMLGTQQLNIFYAWREEHPAVYDAAMDRIIRWVPRLKDNFERVAVKAKVAHRSPVQGPVKGNMRALKRKHEGA